MPQARYASRHTCESAVNDMPIDSEALGAAEGATPRIEDVIAEFGAGYKTIGETVLDILRQSILQGVFKPGERLRQEVLAESMGVSRIPIRTALMQLDTEGLVVFQPRRGAVVQSLDPDEIREVYRLRTLLETHALRAAAASLTAADIASVVRLAIAIDHADEGPEFYTQRVEFYRKFYDAEHNPTTVKLIEQLRLTVGRYRLGLWMHSDHGFTHESLARAVQDGRVSDAEEMLRRHLQGVCDQLCATTQAAAITRVDF